MTEPGARGRPATTGDDRRATLAGGTGRIAVRIPCAVVRADHVARTDVVGG